MANEWQYKQIPVSVEKVRINMHFVLDVVIMFSLIMEQIEKHENRNMSFALLYTDGVSFNIREVDKNALLWSIRSVNSSVSKWRSSVKIQNFLNNRVNNHLQENILLDVACSLARHSSRYDSDLTSLSSIIQSVNQLFCLWPVWLKKPLVSQPLIQSDGVLVEEFHLLGHNGV